MRKSLRYGGFFELEWEEIQWNFENVQKLSGGFPLNQRNISHSRIY